MAQSSNLLQCIEEDEEELIIILTAYQLMKKRKKSRRVHRWWVHRILRQRYVHGTFHHLIQELHTDGEMFQSYFRLSREQFAQVLFLVEADLMKYCRSREPICARQRLAICLRFLATGESFHSLSFSYRVGITTVANVVGEVCKVLWNRIANLYMPLPKDSEDWKLIAANFSEKWQFPHCLGAIDGKHVLMKAPWNSGSLYYNYKGTFSTVLMALVDANLKFIAIDVGAYGRSSDGGVFSHSNLGKAMAENTLNFPMDEPLQQGEHLGPVPYVVVGDEAFPLQKHIMRPFPGRACSIEEKMFNYRLSRARRIVENAFGILSASWRVYHTKMAVHPKKVNDIVKATCVLHNMLQLQTTPAQVTTLLQIAGEIQNEGLQEFASVGNRAGKDAIEIRNIFKEYFSNIAPVPWQDAHVRKGLFTE